MFTPLCPWSAVLSSGRAETSGRTVWVSDHLQLQRKVRYGTLSSLRSHQYTSGSNCQQDTGQINVCPYVGMSLMRTAGLNFTQLNGSVKSPGSGGVFFFFGADFPL